MPKVFVTQLPSRYENEGWVPSVNITPAREHGDVVFMVPPGFNQPTAQAAIEQVRRRLADFGPEDFLLPLGDPILMAAAAAILGSRQQPFQVLKWDRLNRKYLIYIIDTDAQP